MKKSGSLVLLATALLALFAASAFAADYGVVDVQAIYTRSEPGKAAAAHMAEVHKILQKGMDDVLALHKGHENTPESKRAIAEAQQLLNRQLNVEQQAVNAVLDKELRAACEEWLNSHKKIQLLISKQLTLASRGMVDFTAGVMEEMNKRTPKFPALPKVTINQNPPTAGEKAPEQKPELKKEPEQKKE